MIQLAKILAAVLATPALIGGGVGIGVVSGALILGVARNPSLRGQLFSQAILRFANTETTGLFALMMAFLLLYVVISFFTDCLVILRLYVISMQKNNQKLWNYLSWYINGLIILALFSPMTNYDRIIYNIW